MTRNLNIAPEDLVLCESPDGWSLHAPGSTDDEIASGDAPYLVSGEGEPAEADYAAALAVLPLLGETVEAGTGEDHDTGRVLHGIDTSTVMVSWHSGVQTPCPISDLRLV